jgi:hypothetical protein
MNAGFPYAGFDSDFQSSSGGPEDVALESPAFSAPLNATITLRFVQYFRSNPAGTSAVVEAFNGTTWSPVDSTSLTIPDGDTAFINITREVAGVNNARVRFRFRGDYSWYWFIDDVNITATSIAPAERLLFENFSTSSGTTPPTGWTQNRLVGAVWDNWHFDNPAGRHFALPVSRPAAIFDSDSLSRLGGPEDVALESPSFSALPSCTIRLKFDQFFHGDSGGRATVEVFNGTSWVEKWTSTVSSPNPERMCLNITNEVAGVNNARVRFRWRADDWAWWWIVDNVEVVQTPGTGSASIVSDHFNAPALDTSLWAFVNPLGDASYAMTGTQFSITIPAGTSHDITEAGNFAPRIMQSVTNPLNFEVYVKFDALMDNAFQMNGIQVWQDSLNFLRLEFYKGGNGLNRLAWSFVNGVHQDVGTSALEMGPTAPMYMKIIRQGNTWTQYWSLNGINYTLGATFTRTMNVTKIGVYAANAGFPSPSSPAFTGLFDYFLTTDPLPVQLARFVAVSLGNNRVRLDWTTLTETNNYGFEIQKSQSNSSGFITIPNSFVPGHGTTLEPHNYTWTDEQAASGRWFYRLKQIDLDGTFSYSEPVQVDVVTSVSETAPREFALSQNYPNPFNPSTEIKFSVDNTSRATLEVFNLLGQKVLTLFDDVAEAGQYYTVRLNAANLASGVYLYRLQTGMRSELKRMILLK